MRLIDICDIINMRTSEVRNYISTENMLPNKGGVCEAANVPSGTVMEYKVGDILISNIRPYFKKIWRADRNGGCSADVLCIRAKENIDSRYLYYLLSQQAFFDYVMSGAKGSKMPRGDKKQIMQWPVSIPPLDEQRRIAGILGALDDKIELNRRINANLEEQAQARFKSWFVDFEPFRDGPFVDSELGKIPQGWKVGMLSDIAQVIKAGITPSASTTYNHYSIPAYDDAQFPEKQSGETIKSGKYVVYDNSVLLSKLNPRIKRLWFIKTAEENAICSTEFIPIQTYNKDLIGFVFYLIDCDAFYQQALSLVNGATGSHQRFHADDIMQIPFAWNEDVAMDFAQKANYILQKIEDNIRENQTLAALRDTLLPKLIV